MSRTHLCFRPQLEALEHRLTPGGGTPAATLGPALVASPQSEMVSTTRPVVDFATHTIVFGESTVTRTADGVTVHLSVSGLPPGAYTLWMAVDAPGLPRAAGRLAGHVVGEGGNLTFSAHLKVGDVVGDPSIPGLAGTLQDPLHATITLVVRSHGPADPGEIFDQTHTFQPLTAFNYLVSVHPPPP